jgi:small-conductance mechanosensitive channel
VDDVLDAISDGDSVAGRAGATAIVVAVAMLLAWTLGRIAFRRIDDPYDRYHLRKLVRYGVGLVALIAVAVIWRAFAGRAGVVLGLAAAGLAFAMQEVIGAVAGWFNIMSGRIFRVGDRIQMAGVRGDVIDITPLRTKILEIGSGADDQAWVRGRQLTGRMVAVSNKATFTEPVFNYSAAFGFIWEELVLPFRHDSDWGAAERIMREEADAISASGPARAAIAEMARRYPLPPAELEPRVFVRATDSFMELSARYVVPVRTARTTADELTRRVRKRLDAAGIEIASETLGVTLERQDGRRS